MRYVRMYNCNHLRTDSFLFSSKSLFAQTFFLFNKKLGGIYQKKEQDIKKVNFPFITEKIRTSSKFRKKWKRKNKETCSKSILRGTNLNSEQESWHKINYFEVTLSKKNRAWFCFEKKWEISTAKKKNSHIAPSLFHTRR